MKRKHYLKHGQNNRVTQLQAMTVRQNGKERFFLHRGGGEREVQARQNNNHNQNKPSVKVGRRQKAGREHNTQITRNPN